MANEDDYGYLRSGTIGSGMIEYGFIFSGTIGSLVLGSGVVSPSPYYHYHRCKQGQCNGGTAWKYVWVGGVSGTVTVACYDCANFDESRKQFIHRDEMKEAILRLGASRELPEDAPRTVLADWYEDRGLDLIATYLRSFKDDTETPCSSY